MPYRTRYSEYLDRIQNISNKLGAIRARVFSKQASGVRSFELEIVEDVIEQVEELNTILIALFRRLREADKYYGDEGEIEG